MEIKSYILNVLICDDDVVDIKILITFLKKILHQDSNFTKAVSSNDIEKKLNSGIENYDLIFIDHQMPNRSGLEWLDIFKDHKIPPIIMLTGQGDEVLAVEALKSGAYDYIPKDNLNPSNLSRAILGTIKRSELEKERNALLGIAAHELRNPLTSIQGYTQMLRIYKDLALTKQDEILGVIEERTKYLLGIINKLLDLNRIDRGSIEITKTNNDLVSFIKEKIHHFSLQAKSKNIELNLVCSSDRIESLFDKERMDEVFSNLIDNAIKYSPTNSVVEIKILIEDNNVKTEVIDNGPGIKDDEKRFLFNLFSNVNISTQPTAGESSTGLGLAICKKIITLHGGKIEVESQVGIGSTFSVILPK